MKLDIKKIPFSRYGSYFSINFDEKKKQLLLRDVHGGDESPSELFEILILDKHQNRLSFDSLLFDVNETYFSVIDSETDEKVLEIVLPTSNTLHIKVNNYIVQFKTIKVRYDSLNKMGTHRYEYISYKKEQKYNFEFSNNSFSVEAPWDTVGNHYIQMDFQPGLEIRVESYRVVQNSGEKLSFQDARESVEEEYEKWVTSMPYVEAKYIPSKEMASYLLWANTVEKTGLLTEDVTYMSKNWMQNIWSWDNCFNAMLLAENHPELAFNQMKIFMDYQDQSGAYPDFINDKFVSYNCVKPPIHAWSYKKMMEINPLFKDEQFLKPMYESLVSNTLFWFDHRTDKDSGLIYYTHGNDSGWDNASLFHKGFPVSSPDLVAYLIRQLDVLTEFARTLNETEDSKRWKEKSDQLYKQFMNTYYMDEQFVAIDLRTKEAVAQKTSALLYIPLVLAYRFEQKFTDKLVDQLLSRFEGKYGLATEEYSSELFKADGYWLGPIWAPQTFIFVDALIQAGYKTDGERIAQKYCELTLKGGMAENFNPITGEGNDDLAFAWTSSVFLMLADKRFYNGVKNDR